MRNTKNKTISIPAYIAEQLEEISTMTGYSQSSLVMKALERELHLYLTDETPENTFYRLGRTSGWASKGENKINLSKEM